MSGSTPVSAVINPPEAGLRPPPPRWGGATSGRAEPDPRRPANELPINGPGVTESGGACVAAVRRNRLGFVSLVIFGTLVVLSLFAEILSNDKPLVVRYHGDFYFPIVQDYPETTFGGDFPTSTDYLDPDIRKKITGDGNWAIYPPNPYGANTLSYYAKYPFPSPPSPDNLLGTDERGPGPARPADLRFSAQRALRAGAHGHRCGHRCDRGRDPGFFRGQDRPRVPAVHRDLVVDAGAVPADHLVSAVFAPSVALLVVLLSLFGWMGLSDYVRAEFFRNRQMDYVKAARALGVGNGRIIWRHILPNSMTPVVTFLPFRMSAAILALTSLDFLGLGVPPGTPSLGELLSQGKQNIDAWWISIATFAVLVITLLLLTLMGGTHCATPLIPERRMHERAARSPGVAGRLRRQGGRARDRLFGRPRRKAGAGGRIGVGQDSERAQPARPRAQRRRQRVGALLGERRREAPATCSRCPNASCWPCAGARSR